MNIVAIFIIMEALKKIVNIFGISGTVSESKVFETNKI